MVTSITSIVSIHITDSIKTNLAPNHSTIAVQVIISYKRGPMNT